MKRYAILTISIMLFSACQSVTNDAILRSPDDPFGATVKAPFVTMVENAHQPDPILGRVYFEYDNAELTKIARQQLQNIAMQIAQRGGQVVIEGHADHMNTDAFNKRLGYQRALTVAQYLRSEGVWDERMVVRSFGEIRPTTTNWKDLGRTLNRCAVVWMFPQGEGMSADEMTNAYKKMTTSSPAGASPASPIVISQE